jgi:hypothetical protein
MANIFPQDNNIYVSEHKAVLAHNTNFFFNFILCVEYNTNFRDNENDISEHEVILAHNTNFRDNHNRVLKCRFHYDFRDFSAITILLNMIC